MAKKAARKKVTKNRSTRKKATAKKIAPKTVTRKTKTKKKSKPSTSSTALRALRKQSLQISDLKYDIRDNEDTITTISEQLSTIKSAIENVTHRSQFIEHKVNELYQSITLLESKQSETRNHLIDLHEILTGYSLGTDSQLLKSRKILPVRMYTTSDDPHFTQAIAKAVINLLDAFGLELLEDYPAEQGSWWKRWLFKSKEALTHEQTVDIARKIKRGAEAAGLDKPLAEATGHQAKAIADLLAAVKEFKNPDAAFFVGSALIRIVTGEDGNQSITALTLTPSQIIALENNPTLMQNPQSLFDRLNELASGDAFPELPDSSS